MSSLYKVITGTDNKKTDLTVNVFPSLRIIKPQIKKVLWQSLKHVEVF